MKKQSTVAMWQLKIIAKHPFSFAPHMVT